MEELYLKHHGILGQKHGIRNGPPYPLSIEDYSAAEKRLAQANKNISKYEKKSEKAKIKSAKLETKSSKYKYKALKKDDDNLLLKAQKIEEKARNLKLKSIEYDKEVKNWIKDKIAAETDMSESDKAETSLGVDLFVDFLNGTITEEEFYEKAPAGWRIY